MGVPGGGSDRKSSLGAVPAFVLVALPVEGRLVGTRPEEPMAQRLSVLIALAALQAGTAFAQDAHEVLRAAAEAMGDPSSVTSIQYSGAGCVLARYTSPMPPSPMRAVAS